MPKGKRKGKGKAPVSKESSQVRGSDQNSSATTSHGQESSDVTPEHQMDRISDIVPELQALEISDTVPEHQAPEFSGTVSEHQAQINPGTISDVVQEIGVETSEQSSQNSELTEQDEYKMTEAIEDLDIVVNTSDRMVITEGLPPKLPPGRLGKPVKLISNLYPIELLPDGNVYHYDVKIISQKRSATSDLSTLAVKNNVERYRCLSTKINRKVIDALLMYDLNLKNSYIVFDGRSNLYSPSLLKLTFPYETTVTIQDNPTASNLREEQEGRRVESDSFKIKIKPVKKKNEYGTKSEECAINFGPLHALFRGQKYNVMDIQEAIMALETIFRHSPALKYVPIGRSFFHPQLGDMHPLGGGIEIWFGYHQSTRLGQWKPMVNLNTTATTFFSRISLLEYFLKLTGNSRLGLQQLTLLREEDVKKMTRELKNIKIEVTHQKNKRKYTIVKVIGKSAAKLEFEMEENGRKIKKTVQRFFQDTYKPLQYPNLPCVQVKPLNKTIYFPLEVCEIIEGQHCKKELSPYDQAEMIKFTAQPPRQRFPKIKTVRDVHANYNNDKYLQKFDIKVSDSPLSVTGRELEPPNLNYGNRRCRPKDGSWNIMNTHFFQGVQIPSWYVISLAPEFKCNRGKLSIFSEQLSNIGKASDLKFGELIGLEIISHRDEERQIIALSKKLQELKDKNVALTIVVIPNKSKILYQNVKRIAEVELGLMTQCIDVMNALKCNGSTLSNVCQKINAKMGGINHTLIQGEIPKIMGKPIIIMGADVSHAGPTDKSRLSVSAVVGSLDMILSRFAVTCKLQRNENEKKKSEELIIHLTAMVKNLLVSFFKHTRQKPTKIIFYRDGVSEGQFTQVKAKEITAIRDACTELEKEYQPQITYAVVQKRHHFRCKPADPTQGTGPEKNVKPGTVVDTTAVHPVHRDFYLWSHQGLKGTSRPAYYTVLQDDNAFTADEFQVLTHYLCHIFVRCTKSISNPVPVRYAHLAAYRIRLLLPAVNDINETFADGSGEIPPEIMKLTTIPDSIKLRMYFV